LPKIGFYGLLTPQPLNLASPVAALPGAGYPRKTCFIFLKTKPQAARFLPSAARPVFTKKNEPKPVGSATPTNNKHSGLRSANLNY
jgi:hypothetical protein